MSVEAVDIDEERRAGVAALVQEIFADEAGLREALKADGWPEQLARAGFALHRDTWEVEGLVRALQGELAAHRGGALIWPRRVCHLWPALPGAGITPVLFGMLLGLDQVVRPSRRGEHFGRFFAEKAGHVGAALQVVGRDETAGLPEAEVYVVSGSDETLGAVRGQLKPGQRLVGYGHRVSFGILLDGPRMDLVEAGRGYARDVVLWNQRGCFSLRAVVFRGSAARREAFCEHLAEAIAEVEEAWDARAGLGDGELSQRMQALGRAQMAGPVFVRGVGYVRPVEGPFVGAQEAPHAVTVHELVEGAPLAEAVVLSTPRVQGVALWGARAGENGQWSRQCAELGASRVCEPGRLQGPPPGWWHDGRPNVLDWARAVASV